MTKSKKAGLKGVNEYDENGNSLDFGFGFRCLYIF